MFDLQIVEVEATEIRVSWRKPRQPNGIISQYRVKVSVLESGVILENTLLTGQDEVLHFLIPVLLSLFCWLWSLVTWPVCQISTLSLDKFDTKEVK